MTKEEKSTYYKDYYQKHREQYKTNMKKYNEAHPIAQARAMVKFWTKRLAELEAKENGKV